MTAPHAYRRLGWDEHPDDAIPCCQYGPGHDVHMRVVHDDYCGYPDECNCLKRVAL